MSKRLIKTTHNGMTACSYWEVTTGTWERGIWIPHPKQSLIGTDHAQLLVQGASVSNSTSVQLIEILICTFNSLKTILFGLQKVSKL